MCTYDYDEPRSLVVLTWRLMIGQCFCSKVVAALASCCSRSIASSGLASAVRFSDDGTSVAHHRHNDDKTGPAGRRSQPPGIPIMRGSSHLDRQGLVLSNLSGRGPGLGTNHELKQTHWTALLSTYERCVGGKFSVRERDTCQTSNPFSAGHLPMLQPRPL